MFEVPKLQNQTDIQSGLQLKAAQILKWFLKKCCFKWLFLFQRGVQEKLYPILQRHQKTYIKYCLFY